jgi:hypothetical protein
MATNLHWTGLVQASRRCRARTTSTSLEIREPTNPRLDEPEAEKRQLQEQLASTDFPYDKGHRGIQLNEELIVSIVEAVIDVDKL